MAVTVADVKTIYKGTISDTDLGVALDTAIMVVNEQLKVTGCNMSQDRLDKITMYLAAHFAETTALSGSDQPGLLRRSKLGESDESYAVPTDTNTAGYASTRWGQLAIALDQCNILISNATGFKAEFRVL